MTRQSTDRSETEMLDSRDDWQFEEPTTNNEAIITVTETNTDRTPITVLHGEDEHIATFQAEEGDRLFIAGGLRTELEVMTHNPHEDDAEVLESR